MANLVPPAGALDLPMSIAGVVGIPAGDIPTDEQIVLENRRLFRIQQIQERCGGNLTIEDYSNAIVRHHTIISMRADHDMGNGGGNADVANQLAATNNLLNVIQIQLDAINGRLDGIDGRLNGMDARFNDMGARFDGNDEKFDVLIAQRSADNARLFNSRIDVLTMINVDFRPLVKYISGHPPFVPIGIDNVNLDPEYGLGTNPPQNLLPTNHAAFEDWEVNMETVFLRRRLRAIWWFYNDDRLAVGGHIGRADCLIALKVVRTFMVEP